MAWLDEMLGSSPVCIRRLTHQHLTSVLTNGAKQTTPESPPFTHTTCATWVTPAVPAFPPVCFHPELVGPEGSFPSLIQSILSFSATSAPKWVNCISVLVKCTAPYWEVSQQPQAPSPRKPNDNQRVTVFSLCQACQ